MARNGPSSTYILETVNERLLPDRPLTHRAETGGNWDRECSPRVQGEGISAERAGI